MCVCGCVCVGGELEGGRKERRQSGQEQEREGRVRELKKRGGSDVVSVCVRH